jgi:hypothetical protein
MPEMVVGEEAVEELAGALEHVSRLVPYLSAQINPDLPGDRAPAPGSDRPVPADREWMTSQSLIDDPRWLGAVIRSTGPGMATDDPVVAASVFVQGYSYRVLTLAVACLTASGVVPDTSAAGMAIGLNGSWPSLVAFLDPPVLVLDPWSETDGAASLRHDPEAVTVAIRFILDRAIDQHLRPLVESVRTGLGVPIGERLLWGNVASSAATAFRTMEGCLGPWVESLGERFFALAPPHLQGLGSFWVIDDAGRHGWFWERTSCCLIDRLPGTVRCADCSRTPTAQRRQAYRDSLGGRRTDG